VTGGRIV